MFVNKALLLSNGKALSAVEILLTIIQLLEKYYPGSYLYKQNSHSVSSYLFLYDSEHHYMYKASECTTMADCVGFYDSWGTSVRHKKFGAGKVEQINRDYVYIHFPAEQEARRFGLSMVIANGIVSCDKAEFVEKMQCHKKVLAKAQDIPRMLEYAVRELGLYRR